MPNEMKRFTTRARRVLSHAQEAAETRQHQQIDTAHLLLGFMREERSVAGRALHDLGLDLRRVQEQVSDLDISPAAPGRRQFDLSPGVQKLLELAVDEARSMGNPYIGTEHLILGLTRLQEDAALDALRQLDVSLDDIRRQTMKIIDGSGAQFM